MLQELKFIVYFFPPSVKEERLYNACGNQDYDEVLKRSEGSVQELQVWCIVVNTVIQKLSHALYCTCMCVLGYSEYMFQVEY